MSDKLEGLTRKQLIESLRTINYEGKGLGTKTKDQLIAIVETQEKKGAFKNYEANEAVRMVRKALGLSTHGNVKSRTQGLKPNKSDAGKSGKELAEEALLSVRKAMNFKTDNRVKKMLLQTLKNDLDQFEDEMKRDFPRYKAPK